MSNDDLELNVRKFVAEAVGIGLPNIVATTDVVEDTKIYGQDVTDLVDMFGKQFHVDVSSFRWYHHTGPECINNFYQLWCVFALRKMWWKRKTYIPIHVCNLVESARRGAWIIQYPEHERETD
jgi:hypothetical protein